MATHYHTLDKVNGARHTHETFTELDQYLRSTVGDDEMRHMYAKRLDSPLPVGWRDWTHADMQVTECSSDRCLEEQLQ